MRHMYKSGHASFDGGLRLLTAIHYQFIHIYILFQWSMVCFLVRTFIAVQWPNKGEKKSVRFPKLKRWPHLFMIFPCVLHTILKCHFHYITLLRSAFGRLPYIIYMYGRAVPTLSVHCFFFSKPIIQLPLFLSIYFIIVSSSAEAVAVWFSYWNSCFLQSICTHVLGIVCFSFFFSLSVSFSFSRSRFCLFHLFIFILHLSSSSSVGRFDEPLFHRVPFSVDKNLALLE